MKKGIGLGPAQTTQRYWRTAHSIDGPEAKRMLNSNPFVQSSCASRSDPHRLRFRFPSLLFSTFGYSPSADLLVSCISLSVPEEKKIWGDFRLQGSEAKRLVVGNNAGPISRGEIYITVFVMDIGVSTETLSTIGRHIHLCSRHHHHPEY